MMPEEKFKRQTLRFQMSLVKVRPKLVVFHDSHFSG